MLVIEEEQSHGYHREPFAIKVCAPLAGSVGDNLVFSVQP